MSFRELETKEKNLDEAINEKARFGPTSTRGCEVRKLDIKSCRASRKKRSPQKRQNGRRRNRNVVPSVSIVVYSNRNQRSDDTSSSADRQEREVIVESLSSSRVAVSGASRVSSSKYVLGFTTPLWVGVNLNCVNAYVVLCEQMI